MRQPATLLASGTKIRTNDKLDDASAMFPVRNAGNRRAGAGADAEIAGIVGGMGGDVYWARHGDGEVAPYCFTEFELA